MRYVTHHFAHLESLQRAYRWLVQLGFDSGQIEVLTEGVPRIALMVNPERRSEAELIINAAELADPEGWPSFWDLAHREHVYPAVVETIEFAVPEHHHHTTPIGWHPPDKAERPGRTL